MAKTVEIKTGMPSSLVDKINSVFYQDTLKVKNEKKKALRLIAFIYSKQSRGNSYVPISSVYLQKMFSGDYSNFVNKMRRNGIIEGYKTKTSNDSYVYTEELKKYTKNPQAKGYCKKMRICRKYTFSYIYSNNNNTYTHNNNTNNPHNNNRGFYLSTDFIEPVAITYKTKEKTKEQKRLEEEFLNSVNQLEFDFEKLHQIMYQKIDSIKWKDFEYIPEKSEMGSLIRVSFMGLNTYPMKVKNALKMAKMRSETLFNDDGKYYMTSKDYFVRCKKENIYTSYSTSIERLRSGDFKAKRNLTNRRLDTNFTNMPSILSNQIFKDNNLVQLDLANSQFAILCHHLEHNKKLDTEDFRLFKKLAYGGKLYDYIAEKSNIARNVAKKGFFEILFNKAGINTKEKDLLRSIFPSVVDYVDRFKKEQGYKSFSVFLQGKEAKMFIDGLKARIDSKVNFSLTKHDSVIVKKQDVQEVSKIIKDFFKEIGFKGKIVAQ